jgi:hypothetical protein
MMNPSLAMTLTLAVLLVANLLTKLWLSGRQVRHVAQHRDQVPAASANTISLDAHQKAAEKARAADDARTHAQDERLLDAPTLEPEPHP